MKPVHDHDSTEQSCSCTSCLYKSESDKPSLKQFIAHGSRIDKLYYGKYLPLRERKLLERLVRTREVYDDLRKQILSDSSINKPVIKARTKKLSRHREISEIERSSNIISLVDLIDKGAALPSENLSECCSCCVCGSNLNKDRIHKRLLNVHEHEPRDQWRHTYNRGYSRPRKRISKMMVISKDKLGQISEFSKTVRFRTKGVRSEPCTCTYKFSGMVKRPSMVMKKILRQENIESGLKSSSSPEEYKAELHDKENAIKQSLQKIKQSNTCLCNKIDGVTKRSTKKVKKTASRLTVKLNSVAKKSLQGLRRVKNKAKQKFEPSQHKIEPLVSGDIEKTEQRAFAIRKDSLIKFRENLRRRRERKDWECDFECYPDECHPEQCFRIIRHRKKSNIMERRFHDSNKIEKKVGEPSLESDISVQVDKIKKGTRMVKRMKESKIIRADNKMGSVTPGVGIDVKKKVNINRKGQKSPINKTGHPSPVPVLCLCPPDKVKSKTNLPETRSKFLTKSVSGGDVSKVNLEQNKDMNNIKTLNLARNKKSDLKLAKEEIPKGMNRQVVRVGSSFSFNIEFYKDKLLQNPTEINNSGSHTQIKKSRIPMNKKHNALSIKGEYNNFRKTRHDHKITGTPYKHNIMKNTQTGVHPLKRCFCTLQLKAKKTKIYHKRLHKQESVQTNKRHLPLPYRIDSNICIPSNCNPIVCNKIIRERNINHRYISTNSGFETKATAASTTSKSISSRTRSSIQTYSIKNPKSIMLSTAPGTVNVTENYKPPKQAVRIGSSFSFNIEFSKEHISSTHKNINMKLTTPVNKNFERPKRNKRVDKSRRHIRHKYSQITNSAGKSRHMISKYNLRRCFCTLKFRGSEKEKILSSLPKRASELYPAIKTASVGTEQKSKNDKKIKLLLLPYKCEPGICVPGECDPYKCQKLLYVRQPKQLKRHAKKSNTMSRKTRSTSSLTSGSHKLTKTKKVQSAFVAYERKVPNYVPKKTVTTSQLVDKLQSNNASIRQAVKIGSNFSFNIEFYKTKSNDVAFISTPQFNHPATPVINIRQIPKQVENRNQTLIKDHGFQENKPKRKSIQMQVENKRKSINIGSVMKHCFCTLNIYKKAKDIRNKQAINTATKIQHFSVKSQSHDYAVSQTTMTKNNYKYVRHLSPFECEPYVCVPGACDPYECLERIRRKDRERYSREVGLTTKPTNLRSTFSSIQNVRFPKKDVFIQSNIVQPQIARQNIKKRKLPPQFKFPDKFRNINVEKTRQAVNIGSKFSFDIEFYKSLPPKQLKPIQNNLKERGEYDTNAKRYRNKGDQLLKESKSHQGLQAAIKTKNKETGAALLKKCLCTLKLWKQRENNKNITASLFNQTVEPLKVYTMGRIITNNNKYTPQSTSITLKNSKGVNSEEFTARKYIEAKNSNINKIFDYETLENMEFSTINSSTFSSIVNSNCIESNCSLLDTQSLKRILYNNEPNESIRLNYALMEQSTKFINTSSITKHNINNNGPSIHEKKYPKYRSKKTINNVTTPKHSADINHGSPFSKKSFYAMNIQISGRKKPAIKKVVQSECKSGVCKPNDCDPLRCQELNNKRMLNTADIETNFKVISNLAPQTMQSNKVKENNKKQLLNLAQNIKYSKNHTYNIKPYECTPGVCIPDQCNPYQCLKLIEKRNHTNKNYGAESMRFRNISTSSMTNRRKTKMYHKRLETKPSGSTKNSMKSRNLILNTKPLRQAVHIGSNFSFNVEFFKENSGTSRSDNEKSKKTNSFETLFIGNKEKDVQEHEKFVKKSPDKFSQHEMLTPDNSSQTDFARKVKSTTTKSFMKKCFCVAKLHREQNLHSGLAKETVKEKPQLRKTSSFLERCLCVLKSITTSKEIRKTTPNVQPAVLTQTKGSVGLSKVIFRPQELAPYECEPGICTPGLCDPYLCDRIIKNRKAPSVTRINNTEKYRTKSESSSIRPLKRVKDRRIQSHKQIIREQQGLRPSYASDLKKKKHKKQELEPTARQAVRIGSNFSLGIEFYKVKGIKRTEETDTNLDKAYNYNKSLKTDTHDTIKKIHSKGTYSEKPDIYHEKTQSYAVKKKNRASGVSHLLKRCFCTLALQKQNLQTRNNENPVMKQAPYIKDDTIILLDRTDPSKLKPYKPDIYIPGRCHPDKCKNLIRKRLQKESSIPTEMYKTKSKSRLISKPLKIENITHVKGNKESTLKLPRKSAKTEDKSHKHAVKISSNFSFDVEFLKDKSPNGIMKVVKLPKKPNKMSKQNVPNNIAPQSISYKHKKSQDTRRAPNVDSQVLTKNVRSTMTGITPFLKRCFCTLKLQNYEAKLPPLTKNTTEQSSDVKERFDIFPKKVTSNKTTRTSNRHAVYTHFTNLSPYECEPGICIPDKCNPYECIQKINIRQKRMASKSSLIQTSQHSHKYSSAGTRVKAKKSQASSMERKNHAKLVKKRSPEFTGHPSNQRQAVRVGSNFSFNVEFYKESTPPRFDDARKTQKSSVKTKEYSKSISKLKMKNNSIGNKTVHFRHYQSQINRAKTESKGSGMGPILKRCFCTLKLQKTGKHSKLQPITVNIAPNLRSTHTETKTIPQSRNIYPEINKIKDLDPYECEPGVCTPGFCNPYECEKRIKKRQIRELGTVTKRSTLKSTSSITTSNNKIKTTKSQTRGTKKGYRKNDRIKRVHNIRSNVTPSHINISNRQAVRIGSSFSFNVEFYKDRLPKHTTSLPLPQKVKPRKKSKNNDTMTKKRRNSKTLGSQRRRSSYDRGSQGAVTHSESRGSGRPTKLKRCFCTLSLHKFSGIPIPESQYENVTKSTLKPVQVGTQTKINVNNIKRYSLEPFECEPGICVPGECNPNECIKLMGKKSRRHSRTAGTQQKPPSQISISSSIYPGISKSKKVQSGGKFKKTHDIKRKRKEKVLLKEPRFPFPSDLKNRQSVNIGSNFSFDIEFSKKAKPQEEFIDSRYDETQSSIRTRHSKMRTNSKDTKCTSSTCKLINCRSHKCQANKFKTEDKASLVGNILKRCFCTAQLHNNQITSYPKVAKINRAKDQPIEQSFNQQQYYVYYQLKKTNKNVSPEKCKCTIRGKDFSKFTNTVGTRTKNKYLKLKPNQYVEAKYNSDTKKNGLREMEIILPFAPRKFNKKTSQAMLIDSTGAKKSNSHKYRTKYTLSSGFDKNLFQKSKQNYIKRPTGSNDLNDKERKPSLLTDTFAKVSASSTLKSIISRCKAKCAKKESKTDGIDLWQDAEWKNRKGVKRLFKQENLKISKSERRSAVKTGNEPKTSKSLKISKFFNEYKPENASEKMLSVKRNKKYSPFQQGDMNQNKTIPPVIKLYKTGDSNLYKKYISNDYQNKYDNILSRSNILKSSKQRKKTVKFSGVTSKGENKEQKLTVLNILMKKILCKCKVTKDKENNQNKKQKIERNRPSRPKKEDVKVLGHNEYCTYCNVANYSSENENWDKIRHRSIIMEKVNVEVDKISGIGKDKLNNEAEELIKNIKKGKEITFPLIITGTSEIKGKRRSLESNRQTKGKSKGTIQSKKRNEVGKQVKGQYNNDSKVNQASKKKLNSGAKIDMPAKAVKDKKLCECRTLMDKDKEAKMLAKEMEGKICKCYPSVCVCAKMVKIEKARQKKRKAFLKKQMKKAKMEKKRRRQLEKEKRGAKKRRHRDFFLRQKRYKIEDALRLHKRRDLNNYLERRLRSKGTPDYLVATESLLDLAKLSCTVLEDIARSTYRAMIDPHHTYKRVEATVKKPSRILPIVKTAVVNSGAPATFKRILLRCKTMSSVKRIREKLEQNRCTHYLLHIADRDPRKRMKMKKAQERLKRQRVPLDFQCSLYMASLRKKPYLKVYFKCPWFYPHFINLLGVFRQLADMFLFILAAIVWSPCILGTEICRAMMCCLLCTG